MDEGVVCVCVCEGVVCGLFEYPVHPPRGAQALVRGGQADGGPCQARHDGVCGGRVGVWWVKGCLWRAKGGGGRLCVWRAKGCVVGEGVSVEGEWVCGG